MEGQAERRAQLCAGVSLILFVAVLCVGALRSVRDEDMRPTATIAPVSVSERQTIEAFASDRNGVRQAEIAQLQEICRDEQTSQEIRLSAQQRILTLYERMEKEAVIADVLAARGYELPVITVQQDSVNVVVRASSLSQAEVGVILELVMRETGVTGGNVKVIPIN